MNNKKVKKVVGVICSLTLLLGSIPMNSMKVKAEENAMETTGGVEFYDATGTKMDDAVYSLHGVTYDEETGTFIRMDAETAATIAKTDSVYDENGEWINTVYSLSKEAAGGRIRFNTNSPTIQIEAEIYIYDYSHYSHGGKMEAAKYGFDVYVDDANGSTYAGTVCGEAPELVKDENNKVTGIASNKVLVNQTITLGEAENRDLTVYFPITSETRNVKITVAEGCTVSKHVKGYEGEGRIVFYGSSITQGGAVTKPGNTYVNTVGRKMNMEYIDFGMWGRCKGEPEFAEYLASLGDITAFVYDFDHNISKVNQMKPVHYPFYEVIREAYPDIPIIMITRPGNGLDTTRLEEPEKGYSTVAEMKAVIYESFVKAKATGDENVHFIDGESFFGYSKAYMADNAHPNDAGQAKMAEVVSAVLERALAGDKNLCIEPTNCNHYLVNEDFENGSSDWESNVSKADASAFEVIDEDGAKKYQLQYTRGSSSPTGYLKYNDNILEGLNKFTAEMDVTLYKGENGRWAYWAFDFMDPDLGDKYRYEVRVLASTSATIVRIYDYTDGSTAQVGEDIRFTEDEYKVSDEDTSYSFHIKVEAEKVMYDTGTHEVVMAIYLGDGEPATIHFAPKNQEFSPKGVESYLYSYSVAGDYRATVDNIKVYTPSHTLTNVPKVPSTGSSEGVKEHYVCELCEKKFLDKNGKINVTDADLVLAKSCYLINEDFESGVDNWTGTYTKYDAFSIEPIKGDSENAVGQIQYTRTGSAGTAYMQYNKGVLDGKTNYVLEMDDVRIYHSADTSRWASFGIMLRQRASEDKEASTIEFRFQGSSTGFSIVPYYNGVKYDSSDYKTLGYLKIADADIGSAYTAKDGTPLMFDLRMEVSGVGSDALTFKFISGTEEKQIVIPNFDCEPTGLRLQLYGGGSSDASQVYKVTFDNVRLYTDSHTIIKKDKAESTDDVAGVKAHYECDLCGKKYSNSIATKEVTDAELAYAKLNDIMYQTRKNGQGLTDIRFVAYVDDYTQYKNVQFKITLTSSGKYGIATCTNVYEAIKADAQTITSEDAYSKAGTFAIFKLTNNTEAHLAEEMRVEVTWTDLDGNTRTAERTLTIQPTQQ